jgi:hypothetical protein
MTDTLLEWSAEHLVTDLLIAIAFIALAVTPRFAALNVSDAEKDHL